MDHFEVTEVLNTFQILVDNREQATPKAVERYKSFGVPYKRATLNYGDYCGIITLNDSEIYDTAHSVKASCVIERKMSLDELAMCSGSLPERNGASCFQQLNRLPSGRERNIRRNH